VKFKEVNFLLCQTRILHTVAKFVLLFAREGLELISMKAHVLISVGVLQFSESPWLRYA
jgi:hypothetical protein